MTDRLRHFVLAAVLAATLLLLPTTGCGCGDDANLGGTPPAPPPKPIAFAGHGYGPLGVDVIDVDSMTKIATIAGAGGYRMALTPDGKKLYSTSGGSMVYVSDALNYTLITSFDPAVGFANVRTSELEAVAMAPDGKRVYVADESTDAVFAIDTATDTVVLAETVDLDEPENAVVSADGAFLYIVDNTWVNQLDTATLFLLQWAAVGSDAHGVALNATGTKVYAYAVSPATGIDARETGGLTVAGNVAAARADYYMELGKDGRYLYGVSEGNVVSKVDTTTDTHVTTTTLPSFSCAGVTTTPGGATVLVASRAGGLFRLDAATMAVTGTLAGSYQSVAAK